MSTFVIGDVHGCGRELQALIDKIGPGHDLILAGDVFDRGIHAREVWEAIHSHSIRSVLGNHDYKLLQYLRGKRSWLPAHYHFALDQLCGPGGITYREKLEALLASFPLAIRIDPYLIVHAGVNPDSPYSEDVTWNVFGRPPPPSTTRGLGWTGDTGPRSIGRALNVDPEDVPAGELPWQQLYRAERPIIVYGHERTPEGIRVGRSPAGTVNSIGLDTAACHGGLLTAYGIETGEVVQVKAERDWFAECKRLCG